MGILMANLVALFILFFFPLRAPAGLARTHNTELDIFD